MLKIIEYDIAVDSEMILNLKIKVWKKIEDGWQPIGGMFETKAGLYCQTMVKYEEDLSHLE